jgi:hypothetical protein
MSTVLKEIGGLASGAFIISPLGMPLLLHGVAGIIVGGAGLVVADVVLKQMVDTLNNNKPQLAREKPCEQI